MEADLMTKTRLTQPKVLTIGPGRYSVGGGLYLYVLKKQDGTAGSRSWVYRYRDRVTKRLRDYGVGPASGLLLSDAKKVAAKLRSQVIQGGNPVDDRRAKLDTERAAKANEVTFGFCVEKVIANRRARWKNTKHAKQWTNTLNDYCGAWMDLPVSAISTKMVEGVLQPRWGTETARRVQQRIAIVLDWAITLAYRDGPNPAKWTGHLDGVLPPPKEIATVTPRPALPYQQLPVFMEELAARNTLAARAVMLQILTALRPGEVAGALWSEFNMSARLWTIPAHRMKVKRKGDHIVPLSMPALALLKELRKNDDSDFVFPGLSKGSMCTDTMLNLVKSMRPDIPITTHGFRSSFRDWAAENTNMQFEAEASLAHSLDKVVAAYLRSGIVEKRAKLMAKWADYCMSGSRPSSKPRPLKRIPIPAD